MSDAFRTFTLIYPYLSKPVRQFELYDPLVRAADKISSFSSLPSQTRNALQGDSERCLAIGMDDYLGKPFNKEQLRAILKSWLPNKTVDKMVYVEMAVL